MEIRVKERYWCKCGNDHHPHERIKRKDLHGKGNLESKYCDIQEKDYCCAEMKEAMDESNFICFGEYDTSLNKDINLNILSCHPYPEGACWDEMPISYCPFCAEQIDVIE